MFYFLCTCIFLIPVLSGWGKITEFFFKNPLSSLALQQFLGITIISIVWLVVGFFQPLNLWVEIPTIGIGFFGFFYFKIYHQFYYFLKNCNRYIWFFLIFIIISVTFLPFILDHFGYYVPTIQWLTSFGLVKGISNVDLTLSQQSLWHIFQAGFSGFSDPFFRINGLIVILFLIYIFEKKQFIQLVFLPVLVFFSQSPSPDLPIIIISLIVVNELCNGNRNLIFLFTISVFAFAIKPTAIWLPLSVFVYGIIGKFSWRFLVPGVVVLLLFFIKNLWCFGYPVFPVHVMDFGLSWKPHPEILEFSSQMAVRKTFDMQYSYSEIQQFSLIQYIINWLFLDGIKSFVNISYIILIILFGVFTYHSKNNKILKILFFSILIKSVIVLLFSAQYRFFMDVFFVVIYLFFNKRFLPKTIFTTVAVLGIGSLIFLSFPNLLQQWIPSFRLGSYMKGFSTNQFYKPGVYQWKRSQIHQIGNFRFHVVQDYPFSFDVDIPAVSPQFLQQDLEVGIFPQLIDQSPKQGFYWKPLSEANKEKLRGILKTINPDFLE